MVFNIGCARYPKELNAQQKSAKTIKTERNKYLEYILNNKTITEEVITEYKETLKKVRRGNYEAMRKKYFPS